MSNIVMLAQARHPRLCNAAIKKDVDGRPAPHRIEIAGWRHGCCYNVMACEGAPSTTSADMGTAKAWMAAHGRNDERDGQRSPSAYFNAHEDCACHDDIE